MKHKLVRIQGLYSSNSEELGTYLLYHKYKPKKIILVSKSGADDYVCVLANPQVLRDEGIDIPLFEKSKPEPKKKK